MENFFKMNINEEEKEIAIVSLYTDVKGLSLPGHVFVGCGCYEETSLRPHEWTGESIDGNIPYKDLIEWGIEKGYLKYTSKEV